MENEPINDLTKKLLIARSIYRATTSYKRPPKAPSYKTVSEFIPYSRIKNSTNTTKQLLITHFLYSATPSLPIPHRYRIMNSKLSSHRRKSGRKATLNRGRSSGKKARSSRGRKVTPNRRRITRKKR